MLTTKQQAAFNALSASKSAISLRAIMLAKPGVFDSSMDCKAIVDQLVLKGLARRQPNNLYKLIKQQAAKKISTKPKVKTVTKNDKQLSTSTNTQALKKTTASQEPVKSQSSVLLSIDKLAKQLNKPKVEIADLSEKCATLERLGLVLSDDIEDMLLAIRDDLMRAH